jgi:hypothetical protein
MQGIYAIIEGSEKAIFTTFSSEIYITHWVLAT